MNSSETPRGRDDTILVIICIAVIVGSAVVAAFAILGRSAA
jgi:hypothetical protein